MMTNYIIKHSKLSGRISAPPSKSHTLRGILFASLAQGESKIFHYLQSPDTCAMIDACRQLGAQVKYAHNVLEIIGVAGKPQLPDDVIDVGNSGQVLRFVAAIAALLDGYVVLTGDHSVRYNRPLKPLMDGLADLGASCHSTKGDDHAPLIVKGPMTTWRATLDGADSQPVSGMLIASALRDGITEIKVTNPGEKPWVALTLDWFDRLGIKYINKNFEYYHIEGGQIIRGFEKHIPGDFSSIAYPLVGALLTQGQVTIDNVDMDDIQGDKAIINALVKMGANISVDNHSIIVRPSDQLIGCDIDINDFIDALPILAVVACYAKGTTRLLNAGIARKKESDRLSTITKELRKMGALIEETNDSLIIQGTKLSGGMLESHHDHRIALSLTIASCGIKTPSRINNVDCIEKSYPNFSEQMRALGCSIEVTS